MHLSLDGKLEYYYSIVEDADQTPLGLLEDEKYPFVWRKKIGFNKKGEPSIKKAEQVGYREFYRGEDILHSFDFSMGENGRRLRKIDTKYVQKLEKLKIMIDEGAELLTRLYSGADVDALLCYHLDKKEEKQRKSRKGSILEYVMSIPVGAFLLARHPDWEYYISRTLHVVEYYTNIDMLVAVYGSDEVYERLTDWISSHYLSPNKTLATLQIVRETRSSAFVVRKGVEYIESQDLAVHSTDNGFLINGHTFWGVITNVTQVNSKELESFSAVLESMFVGAEAAFLFFLLWTQFR